MAYALDVDIRPCSKSFHGMELRYMELAEMHRDWFVHHSFMDVIINVGSISGDKAGSLAILATSVSHLSWFHLGSNAFASAVGTGSASIARPEWRAWVVLASWDVIACCDSFRLWLPGLNHWCRCNSKCPRWRKRSGYIGHLPTKG